MARARGLGKLRAHTRAACARSNHAPAVDSSDDVTIMPVPEWQEPVARLLDISPDCSAVGRAGARLPVAQAGAVLRRDGEVVACGLVKIEGEHAGLFAVHTAEQHRGRGFGRAIVVALLAEAARRTPASPIFRSRQATPQRSRFIAISDSSTAYDYWYRARAGERAESMRIDEDIYALAVQLGRAASARQGAGSDGGIVHRGTRRRRDYRGCREFGMVRSRLRHVFQRGEDRATWRGARRRWPLWCRKHADGGGNGRGRAAGQPRAMDGGRHRGRRDPAEGRSKSRSGWCASGGRAPGRRCPNRGSLGATAQRSDGSRCGSRWPV